MYSSIETYQKEKDYLIAIDSDGCVFNNMTIKHQQFFFPAILGVFELEDEDGRYAILWDQINLEYPLRGTNRFKGLGLLLEQWDIGYDTAGYFNWLKTTEAFKYDALEVAYKQSKDPLMGKVLEWSLEVNRSIREVLGKVDAFLGAKEAIIKASEVADVVIMSSANHDAIVREWTEEGLLEYVQFIASQDIGTKEDCLCQLMAKGYNRQNVLMIGDAYGDYYAAKDNGAHYFQITYKEEVDTWKQFSKEVLASFMNNMYMYDNDQVLQIALDDALKVIYGNRAFYTDGFQHVSVDGIYPAEVNKLWTMSFYPGQQYLAYKMTDDPSYIDYREAILKSFKERHDSGHMATHDIGFLFELTAYYDYLMTGDEQSKALTVSAADKLMQRYNEPGGFIQAWGPVNSEDTETRIIIDCMMNLPLLHIATKLTGDKKYAEAAVNHAELSAKTLVRDDYSTYHTYWIDIKNGLPLRGKTHQGHRDESTWARGQAWSVYGFYKSYEWTKDNDFLNVAVKCANVFLENLPQNDVSYWDYDFTDENPDIRDTSAASTAAAGLLKIGQCDEVANKEKYYNAGVTILKRLANRYQNNSWTQGCGILKEGMYHRDEGFNEYTSWGDYYYVEALSTFFNKGIKYEEM